MLRSKTTGILSFGCPHFSPLHIFLATLIQTPDLHNSIAIYTNASVVLSRAKCTHVTGDLLQIFNWKIQQTSWWWCHTVRTRVGGREEPSRVTWHVSGCLGWTPWHWGSSCWSPEGEKKKIRHCYFCEENKETATSAGQMRVNSQRLI